MTLTFNEASVEKLRKDYAHRTFGIMAAKDVVGAEPMHVLKKRYGAGELRIRVNGGDVCEMFIGEVVSPNKGPIPAMLRKACKDRGLSHFLIHGGDGKIIKQDVEDKEKYEVCGDWEPKKIFEYLGLDVSGEVMFARHVTMLAMYNPVYRENPWVPYE